jgi:hypothetical protein
MLIHELADGMIGEVGGIPFVHPAGCWSMRLPNYVSLIEEPDRTQTLSGPVTATRSQDGVVCNAFLIHDVWYVLPIETYRH